MTHGFILFTFVSKATKAACSSSPLYPGKPGLSLLIAWVSLPVYPVATEKHLTDTQICTTNARHHSDLEKELGTSILSCPKLKKHTTHVSVGRPLSLNTRKLTGHLFLLFNVSKNPKLF